MAPFVGTWGAWPPAGRAGRVSGTPRRCRACGVLMLCDSASERTSRHVSARRSASSERTLGPLSRHRGQFRAVSNELAFEPRDSREFAGK